MSVKVTFFRILEFLGRIHLRRGVGLYFGEGRVHAGVVAWTPVGLKEVCARSIPLESRPPGEVARDVLALVRADIGGYGALAAGISTNDVYFEAKHVRPSVTPEQFVTPEALATILPPALSPPTLVVNLQALTFAGQSLLLLTACRRTVIYNFIQTITEAGARADRYEPVPWAMLRLSFFHAAPGPQDQVQMRLLVGPRHALGYLLDGSFPLAWFALSFSRPEARDETLLSSIRSIENHSRTSFGSTVDRVLLQGADEDTAATLALTCGLSVDHIPGPPLDGDSVASGLAMASLDPSYPAPDLASNLQVSDSLFRLVNRFEAGSVAFAILFMVLFLWVHSADLSTRFKSLKIQNDQVKVLTGKTNPQLAKERDELVKLANAETSWLDRQVDWGPVLVSLAEAIPDDSRFVKFTCISPSLGSTGPRAERQITFRIEAPSEKKVMEALKGHGFLKRVFGNRPRMEGLSRTGAQAVRNFLLFLSGIGPIPPPEPAASPAPSPTASPASSPASSPVASPTASPPVAPSPASPSPRGGAR